MLLENRREKNTFQIIYEASIFLILKPHDNIMKTKQTKN